MLRHVLRPKPCRVRPRRQVLLKLGKLTLRRFMTLVGSAAKPHHGFRRRVMDALSLEVHRGESELSLSKSRVLCCSSPRAISVSASFVLYEVSAGPPHGMAGLRGLLATYLQERPSTKGGPGLQQDDSSKPRWKIDGAVLPSGPANFSFKRLPKSVLSELRPFVAAF